MSPVKWLETAMWLVLVLGPLVSFAELITHPRAMMCNCPFESKGPWSGRWHLIRPLLLFTGVVWALNGVAKAFSANELGEWLWVGCLAAAGALHLWRWHKHPRTAKAQGKASCTTP